MGRCRFVQPESLRLELSEGDWIEIKRRLSIGEKKRAESSVVREFMGNGRMTPNYDAMGGKAQVMAYLLDWSLRDSQDKPVAIDTDGKKSAALDQLDEETFQEISDAIEAHAVAQKKVDDELKNARSGEPSSSPSLVSAGS
jgi:hypothetical protein